MRKTPDVKSQLTQTSNDLGRLVDVMLSYQASLGRGYEPGPQLATAIAAHRFMRERNTLDDSIEVIEDLLKVSPEERTRVFNESITNYEAKIAIEQRNMDDPDLDEKARRNARERRDYNRRELGKKTRRWRSHAGHRRPAWRHRGRRRLDGRHHHGAPRRVR